MTYNPNAVANNILSRAFRDGTYVSPMKLQKILYFTASLYARRTGRKLLDDRFLTWDYGPVLRAVYDEFRPYARQRISRYAEDATGTAWMVNEKSNPELGRTLDDVWAGAKELSAVELSRLTHAEGSAWDLAFQRGDDILQPDEVQSDKTYVSKLGLRE